MSLLRNFFKKKEDVDYAKLVKEGAQIIDVRTSIEFAQGHIQYSTNIPLLKLNSQITKLDTEKTYITCCTMGVKSAFAKKSLKANGFNNVFDGGAWSRLKSKL